MPNRELFALNEIPISAAGATLSWSVRNGEHWLIRGDVNSGRHELLQLLTGKTFLYEDRVVHYLSGVPRNGFHSLHAHLTSLSFRGMIADHRQYYYQQRYNSTETEDVVLLRDLLPVGDPHEKEMLIRLFGLRHVLDEPVIMLSSGEYRKASIIRVILDHPRLLVLDEPYAGLDTAGIRQMDDLLDYISASGTTVILLSNTGHIPGMITHVLSMENHGIRFMGAAREYHERTVASGNIHLPFSHIPENADRVFADAVVLEDVTVKYGNRVILDHICWNIAAGEKWLLSGRNGAGKSMLLSLIYADNPQGYANRVYLFDRRRGTGESIWEIKERIGYFSSEMFLYYDKMKSTTSAAFRYLSANPYNRKTVSEKDLVFYRELLGYFDLEDYDQKPLHSVPWEAQRLFMLMNVFLGNASLIILDEPYHGLDEGTIAKLNALVNAFCATRTLVFVSHNPEEIPDIITQNFHLEDGRGRIRDMPPNVGTSTKLGKEREEI